jgi:hypothetical protein
MPRMTPMRKRIAYGLAGTTIGMLVGSALGALFGKPLSMATFAIAIGCGNITVAIAERLGIKRPITLFPRNSGDAKPE